MKRVPMIPRANWESLYRRDKYNYQSPKAGESVGVLYPAAEEWNESAAYQFSGIDIHNLHSATEDLHRMCIDAAEYIMQPERSGLILSDMGINSKFHPMIVNSWRRNDPSVYGRFDLAFDGVNIKLLEYNADSPTLLPESGPVQAKWRQDVLPALGMRAQFNVIEANLVGAWKRIADMIEEGAPVHFAGLREDHDAWATIEMMGDAALAAKLDSSPIIALEDIGIINTTKGPAYVDLNNETIEYLFKLYSWERLLGDSFGAALPSITEWMGVIEPPWRILMNKAILATLWGKFPGHPYLLPAFSVQSPELGPEWVRKPIHGRNGANIMMVTPAGTIQTEGDHESEPMVYQQKANLFHQDGYYAVVSSWVIDDKPAGIVVREHTTPIIGATAKTVPHYILDADQKLPPAPGPVPQMTSIPTEPFSAVGTPMVLRRKA